MLNNEVRKKLSDLKDTYCLTPERILQDYNKECDEIKGYSGRELLELLQNAVDELETAENRYISIELIGNILRISNNGNVFTLDGVTSIIYANVSPKRNKKKYIGNKGTGFRSILNWANNIKIYSGDLSIEFNEKHAEELFNELLECDNVRNYYANGHSKNMAILTAPQIIPKLENKEYDTVIEIDLVDSALSDVKERLSEIDDRVLLFLDNLEKIFINSNNNVTVFNKITTDYKDDIKFIKIETHQDGELVDVDEWIISFEEWDLVDEDDNITDSYQVAVAINKNKAVSSSEIYSYFKTDVSFPFPALIHGTFELDANRNQLIKSSENKTILNTAFELLVKSVAKLFQEVDYSPLEILAVEKKVIESLPKNHLAWQGFDELYYTTISNAKIFPTTKNNYISFKEFPKFYSSTFVKYLYLSSQDTLLQYTDNKIIIDLIETIAKKNNISLKYDFEKLYLLLNDLIPQLSLNERAELCLLFLKNCPTIPEGAKLPQFMLDTQGNFVDGQQKIYLPPENSEENSFHQPPSFANLVYLNKALINSFRSIKENDKNITLRDLANRLKKFNVFEYNLTQIIKHVFSISTDNEKVQKQYAIEGVIWLWKNFQLKQLEGINLSEINIPLLTLSNELKPANSLFFGKEYNNAITIDLLPNRHELFVASKNIYEINEPNCDEFIKFLEKLGVSKYPRVIPSNINFPREWEEHEYRDLILKNISFPCYFKDSCYNDLEDLKAKGVYSASAKIDTFEYCEEILKEASTKAILNWISNDKEIQHRISDRYEKSTSSLKMRRPYLQQPYSLHLAQIFSYIHYNFLTIPWIESYGRRFSLQDCVLNSGIEDKLLSVIVEPRLEDYIIDKNQQKRELDKITTLLSEIGMPYGYEELNTEKLYTLLLKLPEIDSNGKLSKKVYRAILKNKGLVKGLDKNNAKYKCFMDEGKVFCKTTKQFVSHREANYLDKQGISKNMCNRFNLIDINIRQSTKNILTYFGVETLDVTVKLAAPPTVSSIQQVFSNDFDEFKLYALCYRLEDAKQTEIAKIKDLKVTICNQIIGNYENTSAPLTTYAFIKEQNSAIIYIKIPHCSTLEELKSDIEFSQAIAEIFCTTIDINDDLLLKNIQTLYEKNCFGRDKLIQQDLHDISILSKSKESLNITQSKKEEFLIDCKQFSSWTKENIKEIAILADKITFENINNATNYTLLVEIMNILKIDFDDFNKESTKTIDFSGYYYSEFAKLTETYRSSYENYLYGELLSASIKEQELFLKGCESYKNYLYEPQNSKSYNVEKEFFNLWPMLREHTSQHNAEERWKENRAIFIIEKDDDAVNELLSNQENNSLLYFGCHEELEERYKLTLSKHNHIDEAEKYIKKNINTKDIDIEYINNTIAKHTTQRRNKSSSKSTLGMVKTRNKANWGAHAEQIVFNKYSQNFNNVVWESENAKKKGVNPNGVAGLGYDLSYTNNQGKRIFVEVKSTVGADLHFIMTPNELHFAEAHHDCYEVALVTEISSPEQERIIILPSLFQYEEGEDRYANKKFSLAADSYSLRCEKAEE